MAHQFVNKLEVCSKLITQIMSKNNTDARLKPQRLRSQFQLSIWHRGFFNLILSFFSLPRLMNKLLNRSDAHNDTKGDLPCCSSSHLNANHCRKAARTPCYSDRWTVRVNLREYSRLLHILYTAELILCANLLYWIHAMWRALAWKAKPLSGLSRCHGHQSHRRL